MAWKHLFLLTAVLGFATLSAAAVKTRPNVKAQSKTAQRQIGGVAGAGFSLLNVHKISNKSGKTERLIFSIGNKEGQGITGVPGYFNVQNQNQRITLDFAQMPVSKLNEQAIRQVLKGSKYVRGARMIQDPADQTLTLILDTTEPVKIKTLQVKGQKQTARVVLDIYK